jgi:hypothetical protein
MPDLSLALIDIATLFGMLDDSGTVQFGWLGNPEQHSLAAMCIEPSHLGTLVQHQAGGQPSLLFDGNENDGTMWQPFASPGPVGFGIAWKPSTPGSNSVEFGVAAKLGVGPGTLAAAVWLFEIDQPPSGGYKPTGSDVGHTEINGTLEIDQWVSFLSRST